MEKIKQMLKNKVKDEVAAYSILAAMCITMICTIGIYTFLDYQQAVQVAGTLMESNEKYENMEKIENLTTVTDGNNIEELQKQNEKELEEAKKNDTEQEVVSIPKYYIKVNYGAQVVTIYTKDSSGNYTKPVKAMVCSTGTYTPTSGVYKVPNKFRWLDMLGDVYAQYCTQIVGDILFHSVPYLEKYNNGSLEYWAYDQLGSRVSLGCIRLTCEDAKWIYDNCGLGTQVEFYSSSNPGPLGKPSARKISSAPENIRGWDPTDPASGNPWGKYLKELEEQEKNQNVIAGNEIDQNIVDTNIIANEISNEMFNEELENTQTNEIEDDVLTNTMLESNDIYNNSMESNSVENKEEESFDNNEQFSSNIVT